jgi:Na+/proline symporter
MTAIDWVVLSIYIIVIIGMSAFIGRRQESREDYYLGGARPLLSHSKETAVLYGCSMNSPFRFP